MCGSHAALLADRLQTHRRLFESVVDVVSEHVDDLVRDARVGDARWCWWSRARASSDFQWLSKAPTFKVSPCQSSLPGAQASTLRWFSVMVTHVPPCHHEAYQGVLSDPRFRVSRPSWKRGLCKVRRRCPGLLLPQRTPLSPWLCLCSSQLLAVAIPISSQPSASGCLPPYISQQTAISQFVSIISRQSTLRCRQGLSFHWHGWSSTLLPMRQRWCGNANFYHRTGSRPIRVTSQMGMGPVRVAL